MNAQTFKIVTGEELIGNITFIDSEFVSAEQVVILTQHIDPQTKNVIRAFGDFPALAAPGQTLRFPRSAIIVMPCSLHEELERQYIGAITGLQLPPATPQIVLG